MIEADEEVDRPTNRDLQCDRPKERRDVRERTISDEAFDQVIHRRANLALFQRAGLVAVLGFHQRGDVLEQIDPQEYGVAIALAIAIDVLEQFAKIIANVLGEKFVEIFLDATDGAGELASSAARALVRLVDERREADRCREIGDHVRHFAEIDRRCSLAHSSLLQKNAIAARPIASALQSSGVSEKPASETPPGAESSIDSATEMTASEIMRVR